MLDKILFSHAIEIEKKSDEPKLCQCGCGVQWRAFVENDWRCADCLPPPTRSLAKQVRLLVTEPMGVGDATDRSADPPTPLVTATWEWVRGKPIATSLGVGDATDRSADPPTPLVTATWEWVRGKPIATSLEDSLDNVAVGPVEWESDPTVTDEILAAVEVVRWLRRSKVCDQGTTLPSSASKGKSKSTLHRSGVASLFE